MYTKDLEELIDGVLADGVITEQHTSQTCTSMW